MFFHFAFTKCTHTSYTKTKNPVICMAFGVSNFAKCRFIRIVKFSSFIHANTKGILWSVNKASGCEDVEQATTKAHHNIISAWCIINNLSFAIISHFLLQIHIVSLSICARSRFYRRLLCIFIQLSSRAPKVRTSFSMSSVVLS